MRVIDVFVTLLVHHLLRRRTISLRLRHVGSGLRLDDFLMHIFLATISKLLVHTLSLALLYRHLLDGLLLRFQVFEA